MVKEGSCSPSAILVDLPLFKLQFSRNSIGSTFFEQDCLVSHNRFRWRHGISALNWNEAICTQARKRSTFLLKNQSKILGNSHNMRQFGVVSITLAQTICCKAYKSLFFQTALSVIETLNYLTKTLVRKGFRNTQFIRGLILPVPCEENAV